MRDVYIRLPPKEPFDAAYNAGDYSCRRAEKKSRTDGRGVPCVYYCAVGFDAEFRSENRKSSEKNAYNYLSDGVWNFADCFCPLRKIYKSG